MGCVPQRSMKVQGACTKSETFMKDMKDSREKVISSIYFLHDILLTCSQVIETCMISRKKQLAILFSKVRACIQIKLKEIQDLVGSIDTLIDKDNVRPKERTEIEKLVKTKTEELSKCIIIRKHEIPKENEQEFIVATQAEIHKFDIDEKGIEKEIEEKFLAFEVASPASTYVRRKYIKGKVE